MANEKKRLLDEIEGLIGQGEFDAATERCKVYIEAYPTDIKGWWDYVLADCNAKNVKDLAESGTDLKKNPVFIEAVASLDTEKSEKLYDIAFSVEKAIKRNSASSDHQECMKYFKQGIATVKAEIETLKEEMRSELEESGTAYKKIRKSGAFLYGNNFFGFLLFSASIFLPFTAIAAIIRFAGGTLAVSLIPLAVGCAIIIIRLIVRLKKHVKYAKEYADIRETCVTAEEELADNSKAYRKKAAKRKKMKRICKYVEKNPKMSVKDFMKYRKEFDTILSGKKKAVEE